MLEPLYTAAEMRAAEEAYPGYPDTVPELMERAGAAVAEAVRRRFPEARRVVAVCGGGSNGGDGRVALRLLREAGLDAEETDELDGADVVVDALFGTGFRGEPRPDAAARIARVNAAAGPVVAVDVPSGVDASTGEVAGVAVRADVTVTFHGRKLGLEVAPGRFHAGEVEVADIGLAGASTTSARATAGLLRLVPRKAPGDTKYSAGAVVVVGGAAGMTGAAALAARAAFRADAGYVLVCAPARSLPVLETLVVEAVKLPLERLDEAIGKADAVALGPGLGRGPEETALVRRLLSEADVPVVVDADALHGLAPFERAAATLLTPHAGELGRLLGEESAQVGAHRLAAVRAAAERFGCTVLLKGADTLVAGPGSDGVLVAGAGPPSLATAGTGDVLTGVAAAFLAKGLEPRLAAAAAAVAHGLAAPDGPGVVAGDVVERLPEVLAAAASA